MYDTITEWIERLNSAAITGGEAKQVSQWPGMARLSLVIVRRTEKGPHLAELSVLSCIDGGVRAANGHRVSSVDTVELGLDVWT